MAPSSEAHAAACTAPEAALSSWCSVSNCSARSIARAGTAGPGGTGCKGFSTASMLSEPQMPQPVRPARRRGRPAVSASHSLATAGWGPLARPYLPLSIASRSAGGAVSARAGRCGEAPLALVAEGGRDGDAVVFLGVRGRFERARGADHDDVRDVVIDDDHGRFFDDLLGPRRNARGHRL